MEVTFLLPVRMDTDFLKILFEIGKVSYVWCTIEKNTHIPLSQDGDRVHVVTRKLDLDQTSVAHTHTET